MKLYRSDKERKSLETTVNKTEVVTACLLINTAEYCHITAMEVGQICNFISLPHFFCEKLEERIKEKIEVEFKEQVSFQAEVDLFIR